MLSILTCAVSRLLLLYCDKRNNDTWKYGRTSQVVDGEILHWDLAIHTNSKIRIIVFPLLFIVYC